MRPCRILIFAKAPVAGKAKTRLIPALGAEGAARLAHQMLVRTVEESKAAQMEVELCASPEPGAPEWRPFLPGISCSDQGEGDLGERLARATARVVGSGENVILIGTDCPELDRHRLRAVADRLATQDAVIHPAEDGGYVLLGLRRFDPVIFEGIAWSTACVAAETIARIGSLGWSLHRGETLRDVDEPEDLAHLTSIARESSFTAERQREAGFPLSR